MTTIMPASELTRKAIAWICEKQDEGGHALSTLIEEASARFNLSPLDVEFLQRFFKENQDCPVR
ncbi:hypothetical protein [Pseudodesulfovibrio pelocollis]|uniref:hypothetical protein n=1 Tax=Pseudodesulfovibrio pelocollis TaxID=3051432 RepID=UPI00255A91BD|nr:hypothetical protein [Pseudodesulfovibrio sp. SB368]